MARRGWIAARALLLSAFGVLGGLLGTAVGGGVGVAIAWATADPSPNNENIGNWFSGVAELFRAAFFGVVGAIGGAIGGSVLGTLVGALTTRTERPAKPLSDDSTGGQIAGPEATPDRGAEPPG